MASGGFSDGECAAPGMRSQRPRAQTGRDPVNSLESPPVRNSRASSTCQGGQKNL